MRKSRQLIWRWYRGVSIDDYECLKRLVDIGAPAWTVPTHLRHLVRYIGQDSEMRVFCLLR